MSPSWRNEFGDAFVGFKALVTGATGFIGWHLCQALVDLGTEVTGVSRSASASNVPPGVLAEAVNLEGVDELTALARRVQPDYIFHLAGLVTADRSSNLVFPMMSCNLVGTVNVLSVALKVGCKRMVQLGSSEETCPSDGDLWMVPNSPYSAAKAAASSYGRMFYRIYGVPVVIVRPFLTYGPRQARSKLIPYTILTLLQDEAPSLASGEQVRDAIFVTDLIRGIMYSLLAKEAVGETLDFGSGTSRSVREIVQVILGLMGSKISPKFDNVHLRAYEQSQIADIARTRRITGWQPRWRFEDGLRETIDWYRQETGRSG